MAKNSKIEWTHHTFNPWWGCVRVSEACRNCYAESWSRRVGKELWGPKAPRRFFSDPHWQQPLAWNRDAEVSGERRRVFCASMADVFENRPELDQWRARLWQLIELTPALDWLLLTKRPEEIARCVPWHDGWPVNVWLGTTVENQDAANERIPLLITHSPGIRFLSCEPLLGRLDLRPWLGRSIGWVIAGGESGPKARAPHPDWFRSLRDDCIAADVPFHFKQWGNWRPATDSPRSESKTTMVLNGQIMVRLDKKIAGRSLDGAVWDGLPLG
jgi:protein gp37